MLGPTRPALWVTPTDKCFCADDSVGLQVDDRLIEGLELIMGDGSGQIRPQLESIEGGGVHVRLEDGQLTSTTVLGLVHGSVGVAEHELGSVVAVVVEGDSGGYRYRDLTPTNMERL